MSHNLLLSRRMRGRRDLATFGLMAGLVSFLATLAPGQEQQAEPAGTQLAGQADSETDREAALPASGWIEGYRQSGSQRKSDSAKIVWTSSDGGPDHVLPVVGPRLSLVGHFEHTQTLAVSPDGKLLASSSSGGDRAIRLWSLENGRLVDAYEAHAGIILTLAFSPDGRWLASGSADKTVFVREIAEGNHSEFPLPHPCEVRDLAFSPDGKWLATVGKDPNAPEDGGPQPVTLWNTRSWQSKSQDSGDDPSSVVFSPDSKTVAVGGRKITLWDVDTGVKRYLIEDDNGWRGCGGFSPDGKKLLIRDRGMVRLLNVADGQMERTFAGRFFGTMGGVSAALSPDGQTVATRMFIYGSSLVLWDAGTGRPRAICVPEDEWGLGMTFTPDGKSLAAGVGSRVFVWDVPSHDAAAPPILPDLRRPPPDRLAQPKATFKGEYGGGVTSLNFSADGQYLAAGTFNGPIQVWNVGARRLEKEIRSHHVRIDALAFSPDGHTLASGGQETTEGLWEEPIRIWEWRSGRLVQELEQVEQSDDIRSLSFSRNGKSLLELRAGPDLVRWNLADGKPKKLGVEMKNWRRIVAVSPAGDRVAVDQGAPASISRGQVDVWDVATGRQVFTTGKQWSPIASLAYAPDGRTLAVGLGESFHPYGAVKLIDADTGELQVSCGGHLGGVFAIAFSPDGQTLASGSGDMTIKVWDRATGALRTTVPAHRGAVASLAFSPDGTLLASGSLDDTIKIWEVGRLTPGYGVRVTDAVADPAAVIVEIENLGAEFDVADNVPGRPITRVNLGHKTVPDAWLGHLRGLSSLRELVLDYTSISDVGLEHLVGLVGLESLSLRGTNITDGGFALLGELPNLQSLTFSSRQISGAGLQHLARTSRLQSLDLDGTGTTDAALEYITRQTQLKRLILRDTLVTDAGLTHLQPLANLEELDIRSQMYQAVGEKPRITDVGLAYLRELAQLKNLDISATGVSDAGLQNLKGLTRLEQLQLDELPVTDTGLGHCQGLVNLRGLGLHRTKITDDGLVHLLAMSRLETLLLVQTAITDAGLMKLKDLTTLKRLDLSGTKVTDAGLAHLKPLKNLEYLHLDWLEITDPGLQHLAELSGLNYLTVYGAKLTGEGLKHLEKLKNLRELYLHYSEITDADLKAVGQLTTLKTLNLQSNDVGDAGLEHLRGMTNLEHLVLLNTKVTKKGVARLQAALPNCTLYSDVAGN